MCVLCGRFECVDMQVTEGVLRVYKTKYSRRCGCTAYSRRRLHATGVAYMQQALPPPKAAVAAVAYVQRTAGVARYQKPFRTAGTSRYSSLLLLILEGLRGMRRDCWCCRCCRRRRGYFEKGGDGSCQYEMVLGGSIRLSSAEAPESYADTFHITCVAFSAEQSPVRVRIVPVVCQRPADGMPPLGSSASKEGQ
jgi:hypothetical protein